MLSFLCRKKIKSESTSTLMDLRSIPLLTPLNYSEWRLKMLKYLKRRCFFDITMGFEKDPTSFNEKLEWL